MGVELIVVFMVSSSHRRFGCRDRFGACDISVLRTFLEPSLGALSREVKAEGAQPGAEMSLGFCGFGL